MASREEQEYSSQAPAGYIGDLLSQTIFPYATQYFRDQFANLGREDSSPFTYTGQRVADFDPRERLAFQLSDSAIGSYRPYLGRQAGLLNEASQVLGQGQGMGSRTTGEAISQIRGAVPDFRGARTGIASSVSELGDAVPDYSGALRGLGRAELSGFGSTAGFDPRGIGGFYNPFEEAVVQQTLEDINRDIEKITNSGFNYWLCYKDNDETVIDWDRVRNRLQEILTSYFLNMSNDNGYCPFTIKYLQNIGILDKVEKTVEEKEVDKEKMMRVMKQWANSSEGGM